MLPKVIVFVLRLRKDFQNLGILAKLLVVLWEVRAFWRREKLA